MTEDKVFNNCQAQLIIFIEIICPWKHTSVSVYNFVSKLKFSWQTHLFYREK
jgi:hypothetical protein